MQDIPHSSTKIAGACNQHIKITDGTGLENQVCVVVFLIVFVLFVVFVVFFGNTCHLGTDEDVSKSRRHKLK